MENIENYQIKTKLDYFMLKQEAETKLFKSSEIWTKQLKNAVILIAACFIGIVVLHFLDDGFAFTKLFVYVGIVLLTYAIVFGIFMIRRSVKKIDVNIEAYKADLRRIEEKLLFSEDVTRVTDEEYHEFDSTFKVIKISLQRMKKST